MSKTLPVLSLLAGAALFLTVGPAATVAQEGGMTAVADLTDASGAALGTVTFMQAGSGVLVRAELTGLTPGVHGIHLHETGLCEPPYDSAGGHFNPAGAAHGLLAEGGPHAGDLPNISVPDSGELTVEFFSSLFSLSAESGSSILDADGTAVMIHAMADDYVSDPAGMAGDRLACGVVNAEA